VEEKIGIGKHPNSHLNTGYNQNTFTEKHPNFKIDYHLKDCSGVYMIILEHTVYIGSTVNFYRRYMQHKSKWNTYPTKELMDNGAAFHLLWLYVESEQTTLILEK